MTKKAYSFRIYPNKEQKELINKTIGSCRFVFNLSLAAQRRKDKVWHTVAEMVQQGYFPSNSYKSGFFNKYSAVKELPLLKKNYDRDLNASYNLLKLAK